GPELQKGRLIRSEKTGCVWMLRTRSASGSEWKGIVIDPGSSGERVGKEHSLVVFTLPGGYSLATPELPAPTITAGDDRSIPEERCDGCNRWVSECVGGLFDFAH